MKERPVNCEGAVVTDDLASEVVHPRVGALGSDTVEGKRPCFGACERLQML